MVEPPSVSASSTLGGSGIALRDKSVNAGQVLPDDCGMTFDPRFSHDVGLRRASAVSNPLPMAGMDHRDAFPTLVLVQRARNLPTRARGDILPLSEIRLHWRGFPSSR